jgi:acyl-coenzyme A thioesterase PaaI-like protein
MNKRHEALRVAGWLAVISGAVSMAAAILTDDATMDLLGSYGLLLILSGSWAIFGIFLMARHDRAAAQGRVGARATADQTPV